MKLKFEFYERKRLIFNNLKQNINNVIDKRMLVNLRNDIIKFEIIKL